MLEIIHSTYEIIEKIGSGGGGIVYLANHVNLKKKVVLKADKRKITTRPELLRREVDVMKNLSHTYIPQVYDYFEENNTVYTVMEYISGESLDKPLKRGEKFSQPQVIKWACQLLEALEYLHNPTHGEPPKGYVHSDIKPANLMRTPDNNISLIDFNIALALGEENIVGHSIGYASPEHYGIDYSGSENYSESETVASFEKSVSISEVNSKKNKISDAKETVIEFDRGITSNLNSYLDSTVITDNESEKESNEKTAMDKKSEDEASYFIMSDTPLMNPSVSETIITQSGLKLKNTSNIKNTVKQVSEIKISSSRKKIIPDVRSDIYMVGATLYHLLCGKRPAKDALEVVPLSNEEFSQQIVDIIKKAMNPNPDLRYQSASEMLYDFDHMHEKDPRILRYKKQNKITIAVLSAMIVLGILTTFVGLKRIQISEHWLNLANYSESALNQGNRKKALQYAMQSVSKKSGILIPNNIPQSQLALTNALGVYDLSDGYKIYKTFELPSEPLCITISPEGKTAALIYAYEMTIINTESGEEIDTFPVAESALSEIHYLDEDNLIFAGISGITKYNIISRSVVWSGNPATSISISSDGKRVAAIYRDESHATVYETHNGDIVCTVDLKSLKQWVTINDSFANPNDNLLSLNNDGTLLGVSFSDGSLKLFDLSSPENITELIDPKNGYTHFEGGFYDKYFAFAAVSSEKSVFSVIDTDTLEQTGGFQSESPFSVIADKNGIVLQNENILVKINPLTGEQMPLVTTSDIIWSFACSGSDTLIASRTDFSFFDKNAVKISSYSSNSRSDFLQIAGNTAIIGSMDSPTIQILNYENNSNTEFLSYDISDEYLEARISHNWETLTLFSYDKFCIYNKNGAKIKEVDISNPEQVNDQQFVRDSQSSYLEVIYNDGRTVKYDVYSGDIISENWEKKPDSRLYEEFETKSYRITCPLHGTPEVYDVKSGELLHQLQEDAYLTYVTQVDNMLITQYLTADGYRYGQILNEKGEIIAQLPYLCDVIDDTLVFDYPTGNIRVSPVYSMNELIKIAEELKGV